MRSVSRDRRYSVLYCFSSHISGYLYPRCIGIGSLCASIERPSIISLFDGKKSAIVNFIRIKKIHISVTFAVLVEILFRHIVFVCFPQFARVLRVTVHENGYKRFRSFPGVQTIAALVMHISHSLSSLSEPNLMQAFLSKAHSSFLTVRTSLNDVGPFT